MGTGKVSPGVGVGGVKGLNIKLTSNIPLGVEVKNEWCWTSTSSYAFTMCTGITLRIIRDSKNYANVPSH